MNKNVTLKDIAEKVGVSSSAVSHALRNKPLGKRRLSEETVKQILKVAKDMHYEPNGIGRALSRKKPMVLGISILGEADDTENFFSRLLLEGVEKASGNLKDYGLKVKTDVIRHVDPELMANSIYKMISDKVDGICCSLLDCPEVKKAIDDAVDAGIPVVTFAVDVEYSKRMCFVGQDPFRAGEVAADQLCNFVGGRGKIFILAGFDISQSHRRRILGFKTVISSDFPEVEIVAIEEHRDDKVVAYNKCLEILKKHPDLAGIYVATGASAGAGRAVRDMGKIGQVKIVCHESLPETIELVKDDIVISTVIEDTLALGMKPVECLFKYLSAGQQPDSEFCEIDIHVYTKRLILALERDKK